MALVTLNPRLTCAATNRSAAASSPPFAITRLAYGTNGQLGPSPQPAGQIVNSFYYGAPVTNAVFFSGLPAPGDARNASSTPQPRTPPGTQRSPPARPDHPLFRIDLWNREQGLPGNKVNALLQSRDGYLWIGTVGGVARFDGVQFTVFNDANTAEMRTNGSIGRALFEEEDGGIWIATERGMLRYANGHFVTFAGQNELRGHDIRCFARRWAGGFWFGAGNRLGFWDGSAIRWQLELESRNESANRILSLAEDSSDGLWVGTTEALWKADPATGALTQIRFGKINSLSINGLFLDRGQTLWIGSGHGVWRLPRDAAEPVPTGTSEPALHIPPHAANFAEDAEGTIWATTAFGEGLFQFRNEGNGTVTTTLAEELNETLCVLVDREGVTWVGARDLGLVRLRPQRIATVAFGSRGLLDHVRSITEGADGSLWFAGRAGFGHWSGREITLAETRGLGPQRTSIIFIPPSGAVWTSLTTSGLFEPLAPGSTPNHLQPALPFFLGTIGEIQAMSARRDGSVWIGTTNGLFRIPRSAQLQQNSAESRSSPETAHSRDSEAPHSLTANVSLATPAASSSMVRIEGLSSADVRALLEDRQGRMWIGTARGLDCLTNESSRVQLHRDLLNGARVGTLHESSDGTLWIGTDTGLCLLREGRISLFAADSGLPQHAVHCILEDDSQRLWISHAAGLARVARRDLDAWLDNPLRLPAVAEFGSADGILNPEMSGGSQPNGLRAPDGRLWFPNRSGLVVLDPSRCPDSPAPHILIEGIVADGKVLPSNSTIQLSPGNGENLDIRFTATSLASPERVRIQYRLEGYDRDWREAGALRQASYAKLRPGRYEFHVKARNHEGRWSERDAVIGLQLAPWFWQTWPFRVASGTVATGLVGCFVVLRMRTQRRRLEVERVRSLELERRRIARDMHDHLGAQLAGIALGSGTSESAHQRVRESLRELNDLIWSVHPDNDTLPSLADFIANFASRYLAVTGIELELDFPDRIPPTPLPNRVRHEVAAMFKEGLRNVVQHAQAKRVVVRLQINGGRFALSIRDNGCGFDIAARGSSSAGTGTGNDATPPLSGNGLQNFHTRSESLGGKCRITSSPGGGTEVEFIVPLRQERSESK